MQSQRKQQQEHVIQVLPFERHCPNESGFFLVALEGGPSRTKVGMLQEGSLSSTLVLQIQCSAVV